MKTPDRIGKYEIQGVLGRGGMGVVYKCYDAAIDRSVAVKAIKKAELDEEDLKHAMERFRHEARAVGRLMHPGIVQIYDYGEDDNNAYIVMELVRGGTLRDRVKAAGVLELKEASEIVLQLLDGIGHAHAQGVVHRDIKPSNIMINEDGAIKIADFGIARTESSSLTQAGDVLGTVYYMSPEQFLGNEINTLTDVYSIGVITFELLTGRRPYVGSNAQVMHQMVSGVPANPSTLNLKLSPAIDEVVLRALAKDTKDRYQSTSEFSNAFRRAIQTKADTVVDIDLSEPVQNVRLNTQSQSPRLGSGVLDAARMLTPLGLSQSTLAGSAGRERITRSVALSSGNSSEGVPTNISADSSQIFGVENLESAISLDSSIRKARILFVDDEERILSALKSLFRDRYHVFTTTDGNKALDFIGKYTMHVIVSDQRMPAMLGVDLLSRSRAISPNSVRVLLTGYSDLAAIVGSINEGEVYRFISKPWDNAELKTIVGEAVTIGMELTKTKSVTSDLPARIDAGVLVIDKNEEIFRVVRELTGELCPVVYADTVEAAVREMGKQEIAVMIIDVDIGQGQLTSLLKLVKQENPQILSLVLTESSDSELVIELINQVKVFRFLNKPVNVGVMRNYVHAALKRYIEYKNMPALVKAQKVEVSGQGRKSTFGQNIVDKISGVRDRWRAKVVAPAESKPD